jgi:hypothetical protein
MLAVMDVDSINGRPRRSLPLFHPALAEKHPILIRGYCSELKNSNRILLVIRKIRKIRKDGIERSTYLIRGIIYNL